MLNEAVDFPVNAEKEVVNFPAKAEWSCELSFKGTQD
jgi:hypothetical protein